MLGSEYPKPQPTPLAHCVLPVHVWDEEASTRACSKVQWCLHPGIPGPVPTYNLLVKMLRLIRCVIAVFMEWMSSKRYLWLKTASEVISKKIFHGRNVSQIS